VIVRLILAACAVCLFGACSESDDAGLGKTTGILSETDTMGLPCPAEGEALDETQWLNERDKTSLGWKWGDDGVFQIVPGTGNLRTKEKFRDCRIHVEFNVNSDSSAEEKNDGNSGIYIQRRYEIQILNSHGRKLTDESCGAIYITRKPDSDASRPAGEWQSMDIIFRAPRWDGEEKIQNARVSVLHNGTLIHDDVPIRDKTGSGKNEAPSEEYLRLQDHGNPVKFRNVWIERLQLD